MKKTGLEIHYGLTLGVGTGLSTEAIFAAVEIIFSEEHHELIYILLSSRPRACWLPPCRDEGL